MSPTIFGISFWFGRKRSEKQAPFYIITKLSLLILHFLFYSRYLSHFIFFFLFFHILSNQIGGKQNLSFFHFIFSSTKLLNKSSYFFTHFSLMFPPILAKLCYKDVPPCAPPSTVVGCRDTPTLKLEA